VNLVPRIKPVRSTRFGDGLATGFEFMATVAVSFCIGWGLDSWLGTTPLFMIALTVMALVAQCITAYYRYDAQMKEHEAALPHRSEGAVAE
jgi:F0F1-type ATP synthase assembly protein I